MNPYPLLPPINGQGDTTVEHIVNNPHINPPINFQYETYNQPNQSENFLPVNPIFLSPQEEQNLMTDVSKELINCPPENLKSFYNEMLNYDPTGSGFAHHTYIALVAMRNSVNINDPLLKFVMSRFVSPERERGFVNYEELIKFLARCVGNNNSYRGEPTPIPPPMQQLQGHLENETSEKFDPDEQAILRLMHENMREWDQVNLIDIDNLRKKFYEVDPYNRYILTIREVFIHSSFFIKF